MPRKATDESAPKRRMGPPVGNQNALKTGSRSSAAVARRREVIALLKAAREALRQVD
jgi:hypothetical protein